MTSLDEMFRQQVRRGPAAVAVVDRQRSLTYAELDARVLDLAHALRASGSTADQPVGVVLDRSVQMAVAVLGVLRAGGAFVPIEPATPTARREAVLADAGVSVCVVEPDLADQVRVTGRAVIVPADVPVGGADRPVLPAPHPDQLCAVYYTSGSTGRPKGVACTHGGWANRMRWMQERHHLQPGETVLQKTTLTFDDAAVELLWPLLVGGRVAMLEPGGHRDPRAIIDGAIRYDTVHLQFVPSMFELFLDALTGDDVAGLAGLRSVLCSGEVLRPGLVRHFFDRFPEGVTLDNTWGATEVSIDSTYHICHPDDAAAGTTSAPIGRPMTGNRVYVLDAAHHRVPAGEIGELCIAGVGLARGYHGDPRRTAAAFVPDPDGYGGRMYRTGDRGTCRPDGTLTFVDRVDHQVKIRGVRVELGEVEAALRSHPDVGDAVVLALGATSKRLAAFLVPGRGGTCSVDDVRAHLHTVLTSYAVPTSFTVLDRLPSHSNGKVDRGALAALRTADQTEQDHPLPRTVAEEAVAEIWCAVLGLERIGVHRDFFAAGGDSLIAVRILSRLRQAFGLAVPLRLIFDHPTIASCADELERLVLADLEGAAQ